MDLVPHFDLPFRFVSDAGVQRAATVDQDSDLDVRNCIVAALRTHIGWRPEQPDFGIRDLAFNNQPLDVNSIATQIFMHEPRAMLLFDQHPDVFDALLAHLDLSFDIKEGS